MEGISPTVIAAIVGAVTMVAAAGMYAVWVFVNPQRSAKDRIRELTAEKAGGAPEGDLLDYKAVRAVANKVGELATPSSPDEGNLLRRRLIQAGYRSRNNVELYSASRSLLALVLPAIVYFLLPNGWPMAATLMVVLMVTALGYYAPAIIVAQRLSARQKAILRPFPDALDLLVSSVEAGLGLDAAFRRVAQELEGAAPILSHELQSVNHEIAAGLPRLEALRNLDLRTGIDEVRQLVNVLAQAERFGTSVARALRIHADMVRQKRMLHAEAKAAQISPKLTVIMILFVMPSLFTVLIGPAAVQVYRNFVED